MKTNAMYHMMRNFSPQLGLVKNARVMVKDVGRRIVTIWLLRSVDGRCEEGDEDILIPRITFEQVLPVSRHTLQRHQFPLARVYATTFNSCQGLTIDRAGVDSTWDVFSHGQLYTAVSLPSQGAAIWEVVLDGVQHALRLILYKIFVFGLEFY
ncbi:hypothetical protein EXIGLDRAFT_782342 [Exidia glandulosa HHB12029]|uniref:DNA helicase n=1 Tax=Exidia glandulosa HHB12029 TaxID=1314781 RepID=A0A165AVA2_EXIGL|nr:hypothetical protein EXIGLDRAFT_782342 [Exidia glandulosa HHB12029]